jgi:methylmalonyl-CoA mutase cobalamin-binding domain/chain
LIVGVSVTDEIVSAFLGVEFGLVKGLVKKALASQIPPEEILKAMQKGIAAVGSKYEAGEYFLSELMAAGEMMRAGLEELTPHLTVESMTTAGTVAIGTVRGDLHDIGKNIVVSLLQSSGFKVYDLGIDVAPEAFMKQVRDVKTDVLAMSALLTTSMNEMGAVIRELDKAGLRSRVKIIVGGNSVTQEFARGIGADAGTNNAMTGVRIIQGWMEQ